MTRNFNEFEDTWFDADKVKILSDCFNDKEKWSKENLANYIGRPLRDIVKDLAPNLLCGSYIGGIFACPFGIFGKDYVCPVMDTNGVNDRCKACWDRIYVG